jgi:hypothetical protein
VASVGFSFPEEQQVNRIAVPAIKKQNISVILSLSYGEYTAVKSSFCLQFISILKYSDLCTIGRLLLKCDGTRAETIFCLSAKRTSPFKSAGASVQSTTGRRAVHIGLQGLYCSCKPVFCSHVTLTGYPLHCLVSPSLLLPCFTVCHHISTGL